MKGKSRVVLLPGFQNAISKKGIKRKDLAEKLGISYPELWKIVFGGMKRIDPDILRRMACELDCIADFLLDPAAPGNGAESDERDERSGQDGKKKARARREKLEKSAA